MTFEQRESDTIIIGAGPAGLAVGAELRRAGVPFVMLEREERVASSWHGHYERLALHTPKRHSALPGLPFPRDYPTYPSRQQIIAYMDDYARSFDLHPEFGREVSRCTNGADGWVVSTNAGDYRANNLVMATGALRVPNVPRWPGQESFPGPIVHTRDYTNGERFRGQRVLVVGFGNSGTEIGLDLLEHGARPAFAVRSKVNVIPRDLFGVPIIVFGLLWKPFPPRLGDAMNALTLRLAVGNLAAIGLSKRDDGPFAQIAETGTIPVMDVGVLARIRSGDIDVRKNLESFDGPTVRFVDGTREHFDAIVLATGFTSGLASLFPNHPDVLDDRGRPRISGRESALPGLFFCGHDITRARGGLMREIGIEARRIARSIATRPRKAPMHAREAVAAR
jgi:cation diffusion facilitator CzcD-associated flavoprotein CzcO